MKRKKAGGGAAPVDDLDRRWQEAGQIMRRLMPQAFEAMLRASEIALGEIAFADEQIDETYH